MLELPGSGTSAVNPTAPPQKQLRKVRPHRSCRCCLEDRSVRPPHAAGYTQALLGHAPIAEGAHWRAGPIAAGGEMPGPRRGHEIRSERDSPSSAVVGCKTKTFSGGTGSSSSSCKQCVVSLFSRALSSLRCLFQTLSSPTDFIPLSYSHTLLSRCAALCHLYVAYNVSESRSLAFLIRHRAILKIFFFFHSKMKV